MTTLTNNRFTDKLKGLSTYTFIIAVGLAIGFVAKEGWTIYHKAAAYTQTDTSAHFAKTDKKVVIYTAPWCAYCQKTKSYLAENHIEFVNRDIESGDPDIDKLYQSIGSKSIPQVVIGDKIINGFNKPVIEQALRQQQLIL